MEISNIINQTLIGEIDPKEFALSIRCDDGLREELESMVPREAKEDKMHLIWSSIPYQLYAARGFSIADVLLDFAGSEYIFGTRLNIYHSLRALYVLNEGVPIAFTTKYAEAHEIYLEYFGEYFEGMEIMHTADAIVNDAMKLKDGIKRKLYIKSRIRREFHCNGFKRPKWIQCAEWPMGKNSPMKYISSRSIDEGIDYMFRDVDTGKLRTVTQYY